MIRLSLTLMSLLLFLPGCQRLPPASPAPEFYLAYPGVQETRLLQTADGLQLYGQWWAPEQQAPRAVILLLHGTAAHTGVYAPWATHLVEHGYAMFAYDMRGWGQSQGFGRAGFSRDAEVYVEDLALAFEEVARRYPGVPVYLQGESLGAAIALQWDIRGDQRGHGLILNAPPVVVNLKVGPWRQPDWLSNAMTWNAGLVGRMAPNAAVFSMAGRRGQWMWNKAIFDPWARSWVASEVNMTHSAIAASYVTHLQKMTAEIRANLDRIDKPMIVLQGAEDYLVSPKAARRLVEESASSDSRWHLYEDGSHCVLHDGQKKQVWNDIIVWLDERLDQQAKESSPFVITRFAHHQP